MIRFARRSIAVVCLVLSAGLCVVPAAQATPLGPILSALLIAGKLPAPLSPNAALEGSARAYRDDGGNPIARAQAAHRATMAADPVRGTLSAMVANPLNVHRRGVGCCGQTREYAVRRARPVSRSVMMGA